MKPESQETEGSDGIVAETFEVAAVSGCWLISLIALSLVIAFVLFAWQLRQ